MTGRLPERRQNERINVELPLILENATGVTRDVSRSGVFFWKRGVFAYGESIRFSIERRIDSGKIIQKCRGVVVRTEPRGHDVGVAARILQSTSEPVPSPLGSAALPRAAPEQPRNIVAPGDDALAAAIETVDRWSLLLRTKALEAREELQGQKVLEWDVPPIAGAITASRPQVTVCSVTVAGPVSDLSRGLEDNEVHGGSYQDLGRSPSNGELGARKNASGIEVGEKTGFLNSLNLHDGRGVRIELNVHIANISQKDRAPDEAPAPKILIRTVSARNGDRRQELDESCDLQKSYSDPMEAFEAFVALAVESAILMNLDSQPR